VEAGELTQEEADALPDPVPAITKEHFEASMSKARRSVSPEIIKQYDDFTSSSKEEWKTSAEDSGSSSGYDIDAAAAEQQREDALMDGAEAVPAAGGEDED